MFGIQSEADLFFYLKEQSLKDLYIKSINVCYSVYEVYIQNPISSKRLKHKNCGNNKIALSIRFQTTALKCKRGAGGK